MEEVNLTPDAHNNIKHKAMLSLVYSCYIPSGELLRLKPEHVDTKRNVLTIKQSKGRKDRIVPPSYKIILMLREYFAARKPKTYLFEGKPLGEPYDERSLQNVLKEPLKKTSILKLVSLHWFKHRYATHLSEGVTNLRYTQEILEQSSRKTTEIYTNVSTKTLRKYYLPLIIYKIFDYFYKHVQDILWRLPLQFRKNAGQLMACIA